MVLVERDAMRGLQPAALIVAHRPGLSFALRPNGCHWPDSETVAATVACTSATGLGRMSATRYETGLSTVAPRDRMRALSMLLADMQTVDGEPRQ